MANLVGGLLSWTKIKIKFKIFTLGLIWVHMDLIKRCHQGVTSKFTPELPLRAKWCQKLQKLVVFTSKYLNMDKPHIYKAPMHIVST